MDFQSAIKTCFKKFATFQGRAPRSEYWFWVLAVTIVSSVFYILRPFIGLITFVPSLAVTVRRIHDTGRSGWNLLYPLLSTFIALVGYSSTIISSANASAPLGISVFYFILGIAGDIWLLYLTLLPGSSGPNKYGDDPLAEIVPSFSSTANSIETNSVLNDRYPLILELRSIAKFAAMAIIISAIAFYVTYYIVSKFDRRVTQPDVLGSASQETVDPAKSYDLYLFHSSLRAGDKENVEQILRENPSFIRMNDRNGYSPLFSAAGALKNQVEMSQLLISKGADVNTADPSNGFTPIYWASMHGNLPLVKLLIEHGARRSVLTKDGESPICRAVYEGFPDIVAFFLEHEAKANESCKIDSADMSLLQIAVQPTRWNGHGLEARLQQVIETLLIHGANTEVRDVYGKTPLSQAIWNYCQYAKYEKNEKAVIELLLSHGANVKARDKTGRDTPLRAASCNPVLLNLLIAASKLDIFDSNRPLYTRLHEAARLGEESEIFKLLKSAATVDAQDEENRTPLYYAVKGGSLKATRALLENNADPNLLDSEGSSFLHLAARAGNVQIAKLLINKNAKIDALDRRGQTPLFAAIDAEKSEMVDFLAKNGANVNLHDRTGLSPVRFASLIPHGGKDIAAILFRSGAIPDLMTAAAMNRIDLLSKILNDEGSEIVKSTKSGETAVHAAARTGAVDAISFLVFHGADVNAFSKGTGTPLHLASRWGQIDAAKALLERGANVSLAVESDMQKKYTPETERYYVFPGTPLHEASAIGNTALIALLLDKGADINAHTSVQIVTSPYGSIAYGGITPLHFASSSTTVDAVKLLISRGAHVDARDANGRTPLDYALRTRRSDLVEALLGVEGRKTAPEQLNTALGKAVENGDYKNVELLLNSGANVNAVNEFGESSLHRAIYVYGNVGRVPPIDQNRLAIVGVLLKRGANPNIKAQNKQTPLHLAARRGSTDISRMLLDYGADVNARTDDGYTPVADAIFGIDISRSLSETDAQLRLEEVSYLLDRGADINAISNNGDSLFDLAVRFRQDKVLSLLIKRGVAPPTTKACSKAQVSLTLQSTGEPEKVIEVVRTMVAKAGCKLDGAISPP